MPICPLPDPPPTPHSGCGAAGQPGYATPAGLRALLDRLAAASDGWRDDPDAAGLLAYATVRYRPLARAWHRDPADVATAAFLAMRNDGVRRAEDPWAVVTRAIEVSLSAEAHAERHLTSTEKARRNQHPDTDPPVRAGDYEDFLLTTLPTIGQDGEGWAETTGDPVAAAMGDATTLLVCLGWPATVAGPAVEYVCARLADLGSIPAAYESLRRDATIRALLDVDRGAWKGLLRVLLGARPQPGRPTRKGILARLLLGETVADLLDDESVVAAVAAGAPGGRDEPSWGGPGG